MAKTKRSRNNVFLKSVEDLKEEVNYEDFTYKHYFTHICNLIPDKNNEKIDLEIINNELYNIKGLVYVFVIDSKILKIGHSTDSIKGRLKSYNCGKLEYRMRGTPSTANFFILQSILAINEIVNVYAYFPEKPEYKVFDVVYKDGLATSKRAEKEILTDFVKKHNKKPIGCTQT